MKKSVWILSVLLFAMLCALGAASAENFTYDDFCATFALPNGVYSEVITAQNYESKADFLVSQGYDMDYLRSDFEENGLRMIAFDTRNNRRFVLTAEQDVDAKNYFDLNDQDEAMRKKFRTGHTDGSVYGILGYNYSSATWKNYGGNVLRFLQTKYTLYQGGEFRYAGAQRRTIRNGYTITLDMQTPGRKLGDDDVRALESIMKTWNFTRILDTPELPIQLVLTSEPPQETHDATFVIKGNTLAKAGARVTVINTSGTQSAAFETTAGSNGKFSLKVTLPSRGVYTVKLTVSRQGSLDSVNSFSVSYDPNKLIAAVTGVPADDLGEETIISGTTESGVTTKLIVTGPVELIKTSTSRSFSFKVDTSLEGTYQFRLVMTKKGFNERMFEYSGTRVVTEEDRIAALKKTAIKPDYKKLVSNSDGYNGRVFGYTGYLTDCREGDGDYLYTVALSKNGNTYKNLIYVSSPDMVPFATGDKVKVYATKVGDIVSISSGNSVTIPKFDLIVMEKSK